LSYNIRHKEGGGMIQKHNSNITKEHTDKKEIFKNKEALELSENKEIKDDVSITFRIKQRYKNKLENYFKNYKGLGLSAGIRQLIFDFMRENNLI
jgi:cold shock CspA family protein